MEILDNIPVELELDAVLKKMRVRKENKYIEGITKELIEVVQPIAKPKAVYKVCYTSNKNEDSLHVDGVKFTSRVLRKNLDKPERVFPYVATCGTELDELAVPSDDLMKYYCLDTIKEMVLRLAVNYLTEYLQTTYAIERLAKMNPGALDIWPITQQQELFSIFGNVEDLIGVKLTTSLMMVPIKSSSGIYFPTKVKFETCQICPREACIGRRSPYDPALAKKYKEK